MSKTMIDKPEETNKPKKDMKEDLTEDDLKKKSDLEMMITCIQDQDENIVKNALDLMSNEIRTSTSSMTAVPKPLKFLRPHRSTLVEIFSNMPPGPIKELLADIISVLSMIVENKTRETLRYKLLGTKGGASLWGHEYLRHLAGEIAQEYESRVTDDQPVGDLMLLVDEIVPYNIKHHSEPEACDLLLEVEALEKLVQFVDESNFQRISLYLMACSQYVTSPENIQILHIAIQIYRNFRQYPNAIQLALHLGDAELILDIFESVRGDVQMRRQIAFMLAHHRSFHLLNVEDDEDSSLQLCLNNENLSTYFQALLKDLQITEAKEPEDIYKSHLTEGRSVSSKVESTRQNMAASFVSAFVNASSGTDKLITVNDNSQWLFKNKENGILVAVASIGLIYLWDYNSGLTKIDPYLYSEDEHVKAGALLGIGMMVSGIRSGFDPAIAMLPEYLTTPSSVIHTSAAFGLGLAYAGSHRQDVVEVLKDAFRQPNQSSETLGYLSLALGLVGVGSADPDITMLLTDFFGRDAKELEGPFAHLVTTGLGLLHLGKRQKIEPLMETLSALAGPIAAPSICLVIETLAYANSGNPVYVQLLLQKCSSHDEKDLGVQGIAVLGIGVVAMHDDIGSEMILRTFDHLLRYGETSIRRAVPLALALTCLGKPNIVVLDTLSKLSHDHDSAVAMGAIFALGLVGVGSNNSRIALMLRLLAGYYYKNQHLLYIVRIAQGLLHMGKGTLSVRPMHFHGLCTRPAALGALLALLYACLDFQGTLLGRMPHLLYLLTVAIHPRMLMTLDENLEPQPIPVRVGTAVDVVGQAGQPKTITAFQTHTTPVLLGYHDRAELASNQYLSYTDILEGFVIVKPNPDAKPDHSAVKKK